MSCQMLIVIKLNSDTIRPNLNVLDENNNFVWDGIDWQWDPNYVTNIIFTPTVSKDYYLHYIYIAFTGSNNDYT